MAKKTRLDLQAELEEIMGNRNVYFQPPESLKMKYDCIRYKFATPDVVRADNKAYLYTQAYELTIIATNPDNDYMRKIIEHFPMVRQGRYYCSDNLNHYTCTIYY